MQDSSHGLSGYRLSNIEIEELECTFDSDECIEYVKSVLLPELDNKTALGIFKKMIDIGYNDLSDSQKKVVKSTLQQNTLKCGRCDEFIWGEVGFIMENGVCSCCQNSWDND